MFMLFTMKLKRCKILWALLICLPIATQADDIAWVWHASDAPSHYSDIALLLDHLVISGDDIHIRQRRRMLIVEPTVRVTPVVHVQTDPKHPSQLGTKHTTAIVKAVKRAATRSSSGWVQLDFESTASHQAYYLNLVSTLRTELPSTIKLSVTVMASWCTQSGLLEKIRAEEIVPLFFRMGSAADVYWQRIQDHPEKLNNFCQQSVAGFALQEKPSNKILNRYKRRYWFNYNIWNSV
jgi:hypothetical protein